MANSRTALEGSRSRSVGSRRRAGASDAELQKPAAPKRFFEPARSKPQTTRSARAAERRQAIIDAALDEFIARGFTATRLDDVARRAGVAKGTIYLHFAD